MQKLWLKDFEHHISTATWHAADDLVQAGKVKALREVEKHFWVSSVETQEGACEVEVMITPHKIKAFTCECWTEGRRLMCAHVAAALLKLRQFLEQKNEERIARAAERAAEEAPVRITVPQVLEQVSAEALIEFVRAYARRDRDFALSLKTWFAGTVSNAENPYALILDSLIPHQHKASKTFREPDLRRLRTTLEDIDKQLAAYCEAHNYPGAFRVAAAVLQKINPLLLQLDGSRREQLLRFSQSAFYYLARLQDGDVSPELRDTAWETSFQLATDESFPPEITPAALRTIAGKASNDARFQRIRLFFDQAPHPAPRLVLLLFIAALAQRDMPEAVIRILQEYADRPTVVKDAVVVLAGIGYPEAAFRAGEHFLPLVKFTAGQRRELEDTLLAIAKNSRNIARQSDLLWRRFVQTGQADYLREIKILAGASWPAELETRLADLHRAGNTDLTARVLAAENMVPELAHVLEKQQNIVLFQQYEHVFLPANRAFVHDRYVDMLSAYLHEHFGRPASEYVRAKLAGLLQKNEAELTLQIIQTLVARFSDRPSLPEELAEMLPKSKRKLIFQPTSAT
jgi:hypothetical protein